MKACRAVVIHYAPLGELSDRLTAERRLTRLIQAALGEDVQIRFTEIEHDHFWQTTRIRLYGEWTESRAAIFHTVSAVLGEVA